MQYLTRCVMILSKQKKKIPKKVWKEYNDDAVVMLKRFVENCQRRTQYEQQLRMERGMALDKPVAIPSPGVPQI